MRTAMRYSYVSMAARAELAAIGMPFRVLDQSLLGPPASTNERRWTFTFSKLHVFGLVEFGKLVFLDADMLVRRNIDELFEQEHMAAVLNATAGRGTASLVGVLGRRSRLTSPAVIGG